MMIRMLTMNQMPEAMAFVKEIFDRELAPQLPDPCVASFHAFASEEPMKMMLQAGSIHLWGAFDENDTLTGVSAMNHPAHVSLLYVRPDCRGQGISRQLLEAMASFGVMAPKKNLLSVNALEPTIPYFEHVGFKATGPMSRIQEVPFLPMSQQAPQPETETGVVWKSADGTTPAKQKMPAWLKGVIALILVTAFAIIMYSVSILARKSLEIAGDKNDQQIQEYLKPYTDGGDKEKDQDEEQQADQGIESIEVYRAADLSYEIRNRSFSERQNDKKYKISLQVDYPSLEGLGDKEEEINQAIEDFAMQTEKEIYESPDPAGKDRILKLNTVYVVNEVTYNVTYATDDFISIVFNDASVFGEETDQKLMVRALNMDLKTGDVYAVKDVFDITDQEFLSVWEKSLKDEAGDTLGDKLPDLSPEVDKKILSGEDKNYPDAFFVDKAGVEIGFSLCKDKESVGWVTAPIAKEEIVKYKTDSTFWKQVTWK